LVTVDLTLTGQTSMASDHDYWTGWMDGWAAATNAIFSQHRARGEQIPFRRPILEVSRPEAAGNKPQAPRKRGRPPKTATLAAPSPPRRRGRPPKDRPV